MGKKNGCSQIPQSAGQIISSKNNHFSIDWPWDGVGVQRKYQPSVFLKWTASVGSKQ